MPKPSMFTGKPSERGGQLIPQRTASMRRNDIEESPTPSVPEKDKGKKSGQGPLKSVRRLASKVFSGIKEGTSKPVGTTEPPRSTAPMPSPALRSALPPYRLPATIPWSLQVVSCSKLFRLVEIVIC